MRTTMFALLLLAPSLAMASGYSLPNTNPRDISLSASAVGAQIDSGAAFSLPAALAHLEGPSASLSAGGVSVFNTWKDPNTGQKVHMDMAAAPFATISAAYGGKLSLLGTRGWGVGLGVQPFGGALVSWPSDWPGRFRIVDVDRKVYSGIVSAAIEVIPQVRVGAGFLYYYTKQTFRQDAWMAPFAANPLDPTTWDPALPDAQVKATMDGGAPSFGLSLEADPIPNVPLRIGVDYKHKATQKLGGDVTWSGLTPVAQGLAASGLAPVFVNQGVKETLTIPNLLNVGVSYRVMKPLLLTATFTFDRWIVYGEDRFVGDNGAEIVVPRNYSNGQTYRFGAEYDLTSAWQIRGGFQRDVSGLDKNVYSPTLPDGSSWAGSLGATYKFGRGFSAVAAVFYAKMDTITVPQSAVGIDPPDPRVALNGFRPSGTFRGEYTPSALVYTVGVGWNPSAK